MACLYDMFFVHRICLDSMPTPLSFIAIYKLFYLRIFGIDLHDTEAEQVVIATTKH